MDVPSIDDQGVENVSLEAEDDEGMPEDLDDIDTQLDLDASDDELPSAHTGITAREASTEATRKKAISAQHSSSVAGRRSKKQSPGARLYNQHLALMGETSAKLLSMFDDQACSSNASTTKSFVDIDASMLVIEKMVADGALVEGEPLWCFAVTELMKEDSRLLFLRISNDRARLAWLEYQMKNQK